MVTFVRNCSLKITLRLFQRLSVVMTLVTWFPRQFRRSLQIKKSVPNAPRLLASAKKGCFLEHLRRKLKKLLKFLRKKSNNCPMMSFIQNGSEIITWMGYNFKTKSKSTKSQATFLRKAQSYPIKLSLGGRGNVNYYKSAHHPTPTQGNMEHPDNFENKSVRSPFN